MSKQSPERELEGRVLRFAADLPDTLATVRYALVASVFGRSGINRLRKYQTEHPRAQNEVVKANAERARLGDEMLQQHDRMFAAALLSAGGVSIAVTPEAQRAVQDGKIVLERRDFPDGTVVFRATTPSEYPPCPLCHTSDRVIRDKNDEEPLDFFCHRCGEPFDKSDAVDG